VGFSLVGFSRYRRTTLLYYGYLNSRVEDDGDASVDAIFLESVIYSGPSWWPPSHQPMMIKVSDKFCSKINVKIKWPQRVRKDYERIPWYREKQYDSESYGWSLSHGALKEWSPNLCRMSCMLLLFKLDNLALNKRIKKIGSVFRHSFIIKMSNIKAALTIEKEVNLFTTPSRSQIQLIMSPIFFWRRWLFLIGASFAVIFLMM